MMKVLSMRHREVSATPVMGPLVSGERMTSRKGCRYSRGSTRDQSACDSQVLSASVNQMKKPQEP